MRLGLPFLLALLFLLGPAAGDWGDLETLSPDPSPSSFPSYDFSPGFSSGSGSSSVSQVSRSQSDNCTHSLPLAFWGREYNFTDG